MVVELPLVGGIVATDIIFFLIALVFGYILTHGLKKVGKYFIIIMVVLIGLITFGFLGASVIQQLANTITVIKPFMLSYGMSIFKWIQTLNFGLIGFVIGLGVGAFK